MAQILKMKRIMYSTASLGGLYFLSQQEDLKRRQKIAFRAMKIGLSVAFQNDQDIVKEQEQQAQELYKLFAEAGGTFVKLGQMIATNTYLFPDSYVKACIPLLDQCPTTNYQIIKKQLEQELGKPLEEVFSYIEEKPIASASIAQVHRGILKNGDEVAIKIQHKNVRENSDFDIKMVKFGLKLMRTYFGVDLRWLANDIHESMQKELDFKLEAQNAIRIKEMFQDNINVYVPKVYEEFTTEKLLIMEFIRGYKVTEKDKLERDQLNKSRISEILNHCFAEQVFNHGFVHCDPHPGNILIRPIQQKYYTNWLMGWEGEYNEPQIVLLDHGIYREIDLENRNLFAKMWKGIILADEKSNEEVAQKLNVNMNDLYYPNGSRELDSMPRVKLLKSMMSFKCFEAENPEEVFSTQNLTDMSEKDIEDKKVCYDYAKRLHKVVANILCEQDDRNLFFLFKNNLYIRNIDIELGHELNNLDITLDYSLKLLEKSDETNKGYMYYASKYLAKSFIGLAKYFY